MSAWKRKYSVGQVVWLDIEFYKKPERISQQYQVITKITPWAKPFGGQCLHFANGDQCHQKWVRPLTKRESVGRRADSR